MVSLCIRFEVVVLRLEIKQCIMGISPSMPFCGGREDAGIPVVYVHQVAAGLLAGLLGVVEGLGLGADLVAVPAVPGPALDRRSEVRTTALSPPIRSWQRMRG